MERGGEVDRQNLVPFFHRKGFSRGGKLNARIVDQHIQRAEFGRVGLQQTDNLFRPGQVRLLITDPLTGIALQISGNRLAGGLVLKAIEHHAHALRGKLPGGGQTDAAG